MKTPTEIQEEITALEKILENPLLNDQNRKESTDWVNALRWVLI